MNDNKWTSVDGRLWMDVGGRKGPDGQNRTDGWRRTLDITRTVVKRNGDGLRMEQWNGKANYVSNDATEWSALVSSTTMACRKEGFLLLCVFLFVFFILFFFFFQRCYKGYSLHDYKFKNTQECIAQMLTSKPMYKESKCIWGCITWCRSCIAIKPCVCVCSQDLKVRVKQALELLTPSSFWNFGIQNFIACSLFSVSLLPQLRWC